MATQNTSKIVTFYFDGIKTLIVSRNTPDITIVPASCERIDEICNRELYCPIKMTKNISSWFYYHSDNFLKLDLSIDNLEYSNKFVIVEFDNGPDLKSLNVKIYIPGNMNLDLLTVNKTITEDPVTLDPAYDRTVRYEYEYWRFYHSRNNDYEFHMKYIPTGTNSKGDCCPYMGSKVLDSPTCHLDENYVREGNLCAREPTQMLDGSIRMVETILE